MPKYSCHFVPINEYDMHNNSSMNMMISKTIFDLNFKVISYSFLRIQVII